MKAKRSFISPERLKDLQKRNGIYSISFCGTDGCTCREVETMCSRGFFSLFIQAVYGIEFSKRNRIPYYVDYGSRKSCYSDPSKMDQNFWNYYFEQPFPRLENDSQSIPALDKEVHPLRIWSRKHFRYLHREVVSKLHFKNEVEEILQQKRADFTRSSVLGVQIRCTDHATEVQAVGLEKILNEISKKMASYDKLFVATDDSGVLHLLKQRYGSKLMYNEAVRSENELAVHSVRSIGDRYKVGLEVLVDCYCLSLCRGTLLLHSNISYAALLFNPNLPYTLLERAKERRKRLKTLFLYYLNQFGIRKW